MRIQSVTVGVPTTDLQRSVQWYQRVFELTSPDLEPSEGVVEFKVGGVWLRLGQDSQGAPGGFVLRFGVADVAGQRARLARMGVQVSGLRQVESVLEYFDFTDPDGNRLGLYAEVEP